MKRPRKPHPDHKRLARIRAVRLAAEKGTPHERIALDLGLTALQVLGICERRGIPVVRSIQPCRHVPGFEASDERERGTTGGRRPGETSVCDVLHRMREEGGGPVPAKRQPDPRRQKMVWRPGGDLNRPPLFSCFAEDGSAVEYNPPPLASLGEDGPRVSREPVVPGAQKKNPDAFGGYSRKKPRHTTTPEVRDEQAEAERRRKHRVSMIAKPSRRASAEVRA